MSACKQGGPTTCSQAKPDPSHSRYERGRGGGDRGTKSIHQILWGPPISPPPTLTSPNLLLWGKVPAKNCRFICMSRAPKMFPNHVRKETMEGEVKREVLFWTKVLNQVFCHFGSARRENVEKRVGELEEKYFWKLDISEGFCLFFISCCFVFLIVIFRWWEEGCFWEWLVDEL